MLAFARGAYPPSVAALVRALLEGVWEWREGVAVVVPPPSVVALLGEGERRDVFISDCQ